MWRRPRRLNEGDGLAGCRAGRHHIVHDQHPAFERGPDQRAAFAVVFGLLAVVGKRHVAPQPRQLYRQRGTQWNALVGGAKNHVEFNAALQQALRVKLREATQLGTVVKQTRIEKIRADASRLGFEFAELEHATVHRELHKFLR